MLKGCGHDVCLPLGLVIIYLNIGSLEDEFRVEEKVKPKSFQCCGLVSTQFDITALYNNI